MPRPSTSVAGILTPMGGLLGRIGDLITQLRGLTLDFPSLSKVGLRTERSRGCAAFAGRLHPGWQACKTLADLQRGFGGKGAEGKRVVVPHGCGALTGSVSGLVFQ